jgi:hypothetical protein
MRYQGAGGALATADGAFECGRVVGPSVVAGQQSGAGLRSSVYAGRLRPGRPAKVARFSRMTFVPDWPFPLCFSSASRAAANASDRQALSQFAVAAEDAGEQAVAAVD